MYSLCIGVSNAGGSRNDDDIASSLQQRKPGCLCPKWVQLISISSRTISTFWWAHNTVIRLQHTHGNNIETYLGSLLMPWIWNLEVFGVHLCRHNIGLKKILTSV